MKKDTKWRKKRIFLILFFFFGLLVSVGCSADFLAKQIIFHPTKLVANWSPVGKFANCEEAVFETGNKKKKIKLYGVYFPCENAKGVVLYSHGNGGNVADWASVGALLRDKLSVSVLIYDYQGYGKSEGSPSSKGILEDARAARKWLAEKENIDEKDIIQFGRSLGGAVAVDLAAKDGAKALITESTFTSLPDMAKKMLPGVPAKVLLSEQLRSVDKITKYDGPTFMSHGSADNLIPFEQGKQLYDASASKNKEFFIVEKGGHNDFPPPEYYDKLNGFLSKINEEKEKQKEKKQD
ncbi:MAG: alpha/beta hydrolase [Thermoguttaceae bacterium]